MIDLVSKLSWEVLITLASGYVGYYIANTGLRSHHKQVDITFLTLVYGLIGLLGYKIGFYIASCKFIFLGMVFGSILAMAFTILSAIFWRKTLKGLVKDFFYKHNISYADDIPSAWQGLFDVKDYTSKQLNVVLKDGTILHCNDMSKFENEPNKSIYMGENGDLLMYVTHIIENGEITELNITDEDWGTEVTYVPTSEIARVYVKRKKN